MAVLTIWFHCNQSFKEMVAMCLVKDPTKRPTTQKLLKHSFFKHAKPPQVSVKKLFADLPPPVQRLQVSNLIFLSCTMLCFSFAFFWDYC